MSYILLLLRLFFEFFKTGLFAVGGGLATIPFLTEMGEKTGWFTSAQLADMIAIAESTPGPIGVNMASYVGYTTAGPVGCIVATLGLITPSIIVILIIAKILEKFRQNKLVNNAFYGLRPASVALICVAGLDVMRISLFGFGGWTDIASFSGAWYEFIRYKELILAVVLFFAMKKIKCHPIVFLGVSALVGVIFKFQ